jgi:hypothetical protein
MRRAVVHVAVGLVGDPAMRDQMRSMMSGHDMSMMDQASMPMTNP